LLNTSYRQWKSCRVTRPIQASELKFVSLRKTFSELESLDGGRDKKLGLWAPREGALFGVSPAHSKALAISAAVFAGKRIIQYVNAPASRSRLLDFWCHTGVALNFPYRKKSAPCD